MIKFDATPTQALRGLGWQGRHLLLLPGGPRLRDKLALTPFFAKTRPRVHWMTGDPNFGDRLSEGVAAWILGQRPVWVSARFKGKVLAVGSIIHRWQPGDYVWGSGGIIDQRLVAPESVTVLAVRGPLTRALIEGTDVPPVYGDPALLTPMFHRTSVEVRYRVGIVPHYRDLPHASVTDPAILVIDVRRPWEEVVDAIRSCEAILSSSLHGLIISEAYSIPASWIRITGNVAGGNFKFNDYYLGTGRDETEPTPFEQGLDKALSRLRPPLRWDPGPLVRVAKQLRSRSAD